MEQPPIQSALKSRYGKACLVGEKINHKWLAKRIFQDPQEKDFLEGYLHPKVQEAWLLAIQRQPYANWIVEIPILFEKRLEKHFNYVICIDCRLEESFERLQRKGFSKSEIQVCINHQWSLDKKHKLADFVLTNAGSLEFLALQVEMLIKTFDSKNLLNQ